MTYVRDRFVAGELKDVSQVGRYIVIPNLIEAATVPKFIFKRLIAQLYAELFTRNPRIGGHRCQG